MNKGASYGWRDFFKGACLAGTKKPNNWGLYDVVGNIYEWCLDWYQAHLGTAPATDPVGPASGSYIGFRVFCTAR